ncbi:hypothetical protein SAMN05192563_10658 [Paraburkholderia aspalathi]|uniref:Uncharacterized protein n=2 Tax=Paraburkholderia aspalathi TaxID=1324617 RepID=A0A1I7ES12_9BURK|nr:hypothetical protein SAMN05192563_10658 [Paraburkholderia aspalathi]
MPQNLRLKVMRAAKAGPDMRKPLNPDGYHPPATGVSFARFIGYFEVGQHQWRTDKGPTFKDTVRMLFELSGPNHPPREVDGKLVPHVVTVSMPLELIPGRSFFDTFARMNFEASASHMSELLGSAFALYIVHRPLHSGQGVYATVDGGKGGFLIEPAKFRSETGELCETPIAPPHYALSMFVWDSADLDDWYDIYIPGEWPEVRSDSGVLQRPARSKNVFQERIMSAANWPEHPLAAITKLGPDPEAPSPEELERRREAELKEYQARNVKALKEAVDRAIRGARLSNKRPPKSR